MKTKRIATTLTVGVSLVITTMGTKADKPMPSLEQLESIEVSTYSTYYGIWSGIFFPNGSAALYQAGYGRARAPSGSFSFEEIYNLLIPLLKREKSAPFVEVVGVNLCIRGKGSHDVLYLEEKSIMRKVMYELRDKTAPLDRAEFEKLLSECPLIPSDKPTPFVYDDKTYLTISNAVWAKITSVRWEEVERITDRVAVTKQETRTEVISNKVEVAEEATHEKSEVRGQRTEEETPVAGDEASTSPPITAKEANRPNWLFYVGVSVLLCVGTVLYFTRRK